jgi:type III secretion system YscD/HrpQ family protein
MADEIEHDTIFDESSQGDSGGLAEVSFELLDIRGKWLVKVVSGPNSGAEFFLMPGGSYLIGTDEGSCDIVFNDLSVSRQHARINVSSDDKVTLEDLGSKNGSFLDGDKVVEKKPLASNALITMGTTTFMLIDRESEHHTIVSPQMTIAKKEEPKEVSGKAEATMGALGAAVLPPFQSEVERIKEQERKEARYSHAVSAFVVLALITGLFIVASIATMMIFHAEPVVQQKEVDPGRQIEGVLKEFPTVRYSFNPANGKLLLIGHLSTSVDKSKMLDFLAHLKFISSIDDNNVVIDEFVWREMNQLLAKNPAWKGVTMTSTAPGRFQLTGFLKTKKDADDLYNYITQNFSYADLLEKRIIVEEELKTEIAGKLLEAGFHNISIGLSSGELILTGAIPQGTMKQYNGLLDTIKSMPGIHQVTTYVTEAESAQTYVNISDRYSVTGYSTVGKSISVVINGRILTKGDAIDGMVITDITQTAVLLEKDGFKYKIDFNK